MTIGRHRQLEGILFILPYAILWVLFLFAPLVFGFVMSLYDWNPLRGNKFLGFSNYAQLFADHRFWNAFWVTWKFIGMVIPGIIVAALLASLVLQFLRFPGSGIFQSLMFFPYLLNVSIVSILWALMNDPNVGLLQGIFGMLGLKPVALLANSSWALPVIAFSTIWWLVGYRMIIFQAALASIPGELYEAARLDGASPGRTFFAVTLPLIRPALLFALILTTIGGMRTFGQVILMTSGGPGTSTEVLALLMYRQAFEFTEFGVAAAVGFVIFAIIFVISMILVRTMRLEGDLQ
jgi:multiple sugar transport system permease protein